MKGHVICDGRGNAGTGACAAVAYDVDNREVGRKAVELDPVTNIVAEHRAIQLAITLAKKVGIDELLILNDSTVPVYQVDGRYNINAKHLIPIVHETWRMASDPYFFSVAIKWVPREETLLADQLCRFINSGTVPLDMSLADVRGPQTSRRKKRKISAQKRQKLPNPYLSIPTRIPPRSSR